MNELAKTFEIGLEMEHMHAGDDEEDDFEEDDEEGDEGEEED